MQGDIVVAPSTQWAHWGGAPIMARRWRLLFERMLVRSIGGRQS
jgi:hypothetical protein